MIRALPGSLVSGLVVVVIAGCAPTGPPTPQTDGNFPQPRRYDSRGAATLTIEDLDLVGLYEMKYFVLPGDMLRITGLEAELDDDVLLRERLFGDPEEVPLKCNTAHLAEPADGSLGPGTLASYSAGEIRVDAMTFAERATDGSCPGTGLLTLVGSNTSSADGIHNPAGNVARLSTPLTVVINGHSLSGALALDGEYTNRPPVARIASVAPDLYDFSDWGCPPVRAQSMDGVWEWPDPPQTRGNKPEGLEVEFSSVSFDPDGHGAPTLGNSGPRVDLVSEQWSHWRGGAYRHLGNGHRLPSMIFERGVLHRVLLTVIDRSGARSQAECRFVVVD